MKNQSDLVGNWGCTNIKIFLELKFGSSLRKKKILLREETCDRVRAFWRVVFPSCLFVCGDRCDTGTWHCFDLPMRNARHREISISVHGGRHTGDEIGKKLNCSFSSSKRWKIVLFRSSTIEWLSIHLSLQKIGVHVAYFKSYSWFSEANQVLQWWRLLYLALRNSGMNW